MRGQKRSPDPSLCKGLGVSPSGSFAGQSRPASRRQREDLVRLAPVRSAFALSKGTCGSPRMTRDRQDTGLAGGRRRTARCSIECQAERRQHGVLISMSGKGNGYDHSRVETFFKTLKSELVWRTAFQTRAEASQALARYIDGFSNPVRRHSALDFVSPAQFERRTSQTALH